MRRNRIEEFLDIFGNFITDTPKENKEPKTTVITDISEESDETEL